MIVDGDVLVRVGNEDIVNGKFIIPDEITIIDDDAFYFTNKLTDIAIPDGISKIGRLAFSECHKLKSIVLPSSLIDIGAGAFFACISLQEIVIPNNVQEIKISTFAKCNALQKIQIPEGMELSKRWFTNQANPKCIVYQGSKRYKVEDILHYY